MSTVKRIEPVRLRLPAASTKSSAKAFTLIDLPHHVFPDVPFGSLFAYCFRRFGNPNAGWDDYKDLVRWQLEAFGGRLLVQVDPKLSNVRQFRIYAAKSVAAEIESFEEVHWAAWRAGRDALLTTSPDATWIASLGTCNEITKKMLTGAYSRETLARLQVATKDATKRYQVLQPDPLAWRNAADLSAWNAEDPLLPYALDAKRIVKDLSRFVRVRDQAFNAHGDVHEARGSVIHEAKSAGYPSGALGNVDPRTMARIHSAVYTLGGGNPVKGLSLAAELVEKSLPSTTQKSPISPLHS